MVSKRTKHLRHADPELPFAECGEQLEFEHRAPVVVWVAEAIGDERVDIQRLSPLIDGCAVRVSREAGAEALHEADFNLASQCARTGAVDRALRVGPARPRVGPKVRVAVLIDTESVGGSPPP